MRFINVSHGIFAACGRETLVDVNPRKTLVDTVRDIDKSLERERKRERERSSEGERKSFARNSSMSL